MQLPLMLSFAMTIHKAQGLTLDKVVADCGNDCRFAPGMAYTAISRVRRLDDIVLIDFAAEAFPTRAKVETEIHRLKQRKRNGTSSSKCKHAMKANEVDGMTEVDGVDDIGIDGGRSVEEIEILETEQDLEED
jgi:hypothetical protein